MRIFTHLRSLAQDLLRVARAPQLRNKYVIVLVLAAVWMLFFDQYDLRSLMKLSNRVEGLEQDKTYYQEEITRIRHEMHLLTVDRKAVERFARSRYLMKHPEEDLFIVVDETEE